MKPFLENLFYSLPIQLLIHHVKRNLPLLAIWAFFVAAVFGGIGKVYGIQYLFLDPEYLNTVGFWSFFIMGLAFANFTMAFFITSYILDGHKFSFIGILERPFLKFSLNNALLPITVLVVYLIKIMQFQIANEEHDFLGLIQILTGFLVGTISFLLITFIYFRFTNKDIFKYLAGSVDKRLRKTKLSRERMMIKWKESKHRNPVKSYLDLKFRVHQCGHLHNFYDRQAILKVFDQNHFNSVIYDLLIIALVLVFGTFMDIPIFQLPAAASVLLLFSIVIMMIGAITYWFKRWGVAFFLALFIIANVLVEKGAIRKIHRAAGMDYYGEKVTYNMKSLSASCSEDDYHRDRQEVQHMLENWREKQGVEKPKLLLLCTSGGGQRAAMWTFLALQRADRSFGEDLMDKVFMISGASGGLVGAAYYRELFDQGFDLQRAGWLSNLGKDNLNPIIFSLAVNDTFLKLSSFSHAGYSYKKDRGYMFERSLNNNLEGIFTRNVKEYRDDELAAKMPWLLLSPTIANDGRKLFISNPGASFLNFDLQDDPTYETKVRGVDFLRFFDGQQAGNISMLTALRMSASFPYITPTISLPSEPRLEVMDAGISDNFGISSTLRVIRVFQDWIELNTSGVVLMVIRDTKRVEQPRSRPNASIVDRFFQPISDVYNNLANMQDINNDAAINAVDNWLDVPFDIVEVAYDSEAQQQDRASLSWHLTNKEKQTIVNAIDLPSNQSAIERLRDLVAH